LNWGDNDIVLLPDPTSTDELPLYPTVIPFAVPDVSLQSIVNVLPDPGGTVREVDTVEAPEATLKLWVIVDISDADIVNVHVVILGDVNVLA